jgi:exosortase family protein XrtF
MTWREIKPSFIFLSRFLVFYLVANLLYAWWITRYSPAPDPATRQITHHSAFILEVAGYEIHTITHHSRAAERILLGERAVLSVFEGCNGINVWIIFAAFIVAFSGVTKKVLVFVLAGTAIIYVVNLARIIFLFFISLHYPDALYFFHKYFFTAGIYAVVFAMWYYWIRNYGKAAQGKP